MSDAKGFGRASGCQLAADRASMRHSDHLLFVAVIGLVHLERDQKLEEWRK